MKFTKIIFFALLLSVGFQPCADALGNDLARNMKKTIYTMMAMAALTGFATAIIIICLVKKSSEKA